MRRMISGVAMALTLSGAGGSVLAQSYSSGPYQYGAPGAYGRERTDHALFDRVRMDLDRAAAYPYASRPDRKRFDEARREFFDFEARFDQGRYDRHVFDTAIDRINRVVSQNSLDPRERGTLSDDLRQLRDYREFRAHNRGGNYGAWSYR